MFSLACAHQIGAVDCGCVPAPHALYSKMLTERTASRNVLVLFVLFCCHSAHQTTHLNWDRVDEWWLFSTLDSHHVSATHVMPRQPWILGAWNAYHCGAHIWWRRHDDDGRTSAARSGRVQSTVASIVNLSLVWTPLPALLATSSDQTTFASNTSVIVYDKYTDPEDILNGGSASDEHGTCTWVTIDTSRNCLNRRF